MHDEPTAAEVRDSLARLLASPSFARARRAQAFLRFVVEETLAGRDQGVNGYAIAVAAFKKAADFDAANDPLVRVEAGRVRSRLRAYYAGAGRADRIHIELRVGSYVPTFGYAAAPAPPPVEARRARRRSAAPLAALPALGLVAVVWALGVGSAPLSDEPGRDDDRAAAQAATRIVVQTFRSVDAERGSLPQALVVTDELMTQLGQHSSVRVVVAPTAGLAVGHRHVRRNPVAGDLALTGSVRVTDRAIRVQPRLVDAHTGRLVWTAVYDEPLAVDDVRHIVDDIVAAMARNAGTRHPPLRDAGVASSRP